MNTASAGWSDGSVRLPKSMRNRFPPRCARGTSPPHQGRTALSHPPHRLTSRVQSILDVIICRILEEGAAGLRIFATGEFSWDHLPDNKATNAERELARKWRPAFSKPSVTGACSRAGYGKKQLGSGTVYQKIMLKPRHYRPSRMPLAPCRSEQQLRVLTTTLLSVADREWRPCPLRSCRQQHTHTKLVQATTPSNTPTPTVLEPSTN
ncbi:hypothetical protein Bbelb_306650 [Branchiostoma belcheri]|nr:hypothetical protein Bbelb_306650 [Branchiostoma belcheri]